MEKKSYFCIRFARRRMTMEFLGMFECQKDV